MSQKKFRSYLHFSYEICAGGDGLFFLISDCICDVKSKKKEALVKQNVAQHAACLSIPCIVQYWHIIGNIFWMFLPAIKAYIMKNSTHHYYCHCSAEVYSDAIRYNWKPICIRYLLKCSISVIYVPSRFK